jgi:hypothetical protein
MVLPQELKKKMKEAKYVSMSDGNSNNMPLSSGENMSMSSDSNELTGSIVNVKAYQTAQGLAVAAHDMFLII